MTSMEPPAAAWLGVTRREFDGAQHPLGRPNEDEIAVAFASKHACELRYCHDWGKWLRWDGSRWQRDDRRLAFHYARQAAREANIDRRTGPAKATTASGVERFAQADPLLATSSKDWDKNHWLLVTPGGTVDLRTGQLRPNQREDYITKRVTVTPGPIATPLWNAFLADATRNDDQLIAYLQRMAGYCLTGAVSEHALFFIHGGGGNGKGVFINTLTRIVGDYATVASMEALTASRNDRHPTELAMLQGARLVTAQETEEGRAWKEVQIKVLTGGDPISARFMRQDFFTFEPTFKLLIAGNHKPNLRSVDEAIKRRVNIIPFTHKPERPDPLLTEKLQSEWPGILRWCIDGCLAWQQQGLNPPEVVRGATQQYFADQDLFAQWVAECCDTSPSGSDTFANLFGSWKRWAEDNGEAPGSSKSFSQTLIRAGFEPMKNTPGHHGKRGFTGLSVKLTDTTYQWQNQHDR
jgi:putative DNA primase/helicase